MGSPDLPPVTSGVWCLLGEPRTAARLADAGFDWVCLDGQHGAFDDGGLLATLERIPADARPAVRVSAPDPVAVGRALDAGAEIVIVPVVDSAADAATVAAAAHYPPLGRRSWGPLAPAWGRPALDAAQANERVRVWVMIETAGALAELDAILATPGVDGAFVGPYDLALALGLPLDELLAAEGEDAPLRRIAAACARHGRRAGAFAGDAAKTARLRELGFSDLAIATDAGLLAAASSSALGDDARPGGY